MESDTTSPRKGMTFISPSAPANGGLSWDFPHQCSLVSQVVSWPGALGVSSEAGGFSSQGASDLSIRSRLRVSRTALSTLFLFQRVAGRFLKTCSLFMSLMLGSLPLLVSGLDVALVSIRPILPPLPQPNEKAWLPQFRAWQGSHGPGDGHRDAPLGSGEEAFVSLVSNGRQQAAF